MAFNITALLGMTFPAGSFGENIYIAEGGKIRLIAEAIYRRDYSQIEVPRHLQLHYSTGQPVDQERNESARVRPEPIDNLIPPS